MFEISSTPSNLLRKRTAMAVSNYGYDGYFAFYEQKSGDNRILLIQVDLENKTLDQSTSIASDYYPTGIQIDSTGVQYLLTFKTDGFRMIKVRYQKLIVVKLCIFDNKYYMF